MINNEFKLITDVKYMQNLDDSPINYLLDI